MKVKYLTLLALSAGTLQAQDAVFVDIAPCLMLELHATRMACYEDLDAAVRAARPASATVQATEPQAPVVAQPAPASATPVDPTPAAVIESFGNQTPVTARVLANEAGEQELLDTITGLREREPGRWLITLASGQVWYQTNSARIRLREGMEVRIYPSPLGGSFRMAGPTAATLASSRSVASNSGLFPACK